MITRLIVEAVSNEMIVTDSETKLSVTVSVSDSNYGEPTTGLTMDMLKITDVGVSGPNGNLRYKLIVNERVWDPEDNVKSGVYDLTITAPIFVTPGGFGPNINFQKGKPFAIGIQVIASPKAYNGYGAQGQTVVSIVNV